MAHRILALVLEFAQISYILITYLTFVIVETGSHHVALAGLDLREAPVQGLRHEPRAYAFPCNEQP